MATASTNNGIVGDPRWLMNSTGIDNLSNSLSRIIVYTNNGTVYVKGLLQNSIVEVYSFNGVRIINQYTSSDEIAIHLPKGSYIIKVISNDAINVHKLINQ